MFLSHPPWGSKLGYDSQAPPREASAHDLDGCVIHGPIIAVRFGF